MPKYLTPEALEKFKADLEYLQNVKRKEVAEKIKDAASFGDLKENAAYHAAKEEQGWLEVKIKELRNVVAHAQIVEKQDNDKVGLGSVVSLESKDGKEKFQIVEPEEADILDSKISFKSPLGEALLNKKKGSAVKVKTSQGKTEYKITDIG